MVEMSTKQMVTKQQKNNFIITKGEGIREVDLFMLLCSCVFQCVCVCVSSAQFLYFKLSAASGRKRSSSCNIFLKMLREESSGAALSSFLSVFLHTGSYLRFLPPSLQAPPLYL